MVGPAEVVLSFPEGRFKLVLAGLGLFDEARDERGKVKRDGMKKMAMLSYWSRFRMWSLGI